MSYIITADIRGVRYWIRVDETAHHGAILKFSYQGLKNNASEYGNKEAAENAMKKVSAKSPWELKVESY